MLSVKFVLSNAKKYTHLRTGNSNIQLAKGFAVLFGKCASAIGYAERNNYCRWWFGWGNNKFGGAVQEQFCCTLYSRVAGRWRVSTITHSQQSIRPGKKPIHYSNWWRPYFASAFYCRSFGSGKAGKFISGTRALLNEEITKKILSDNNLNPTIIMQTTGKPYNAIRSRHLSAVLRLFQRSKKTFTLCWAATWHFGKPISKK